MVICVSCNFYIDYRFSVFNRKADIVQYSNEEYDLCLQDSSWSREETDKLMEFCYRYDLRFTVIAGCWESEGCPERDMEVS
jgi:DNA methyltransferase 1-associated protein 1